MEKTFHPSGFPLWLTGKTSNGPPPTLFLCVEVLKLHRASWRKMATSARIKQYGPLMIWPYNNKATSCTKWVSQAQCFPSKGSWGKEASKHVHKHTLLGSMGWWKIKSLQHHMQTMPCGTTLSNKSLYYFMSSWLSLYLSALLYTLSYTLLLRILSLASSTWSGHLEWGSVHWQSEG